MLCLSGFELLFSLGAPGKFVGERDFRIQNSSGRTIKPQGSAIQTGIN